MSRAMPVITSLEWRKLLEHHPQAHFMQSAEWGELKASLGWEPVRITGEQGGAQILFRKVTPFLSMGYIPKGPVGALDPGLRAEIDVACIQKKAFLLKIEPDQWQDDPQSQSFTGFITSRQNIQPANTILVDLTQDEEVILNRMRQKTRYNINLAIKKEITVTTWDDIQAFHQMLKTTSTRDEFGVHTLDYYKKAYELFHPSGRCELLAAWYAGQPLAALMVFKNNNRAWYVYGASSNLGRNRMPTYLLQWEAMYWAKKTGCTSYDLWGIPDAPEQELEAHFSERSHGLWGVYRFKRGFGGTIRRNQQAMDKIYNPWFYRLYSLWLAGRAEVA